VPSSQQQVRVLRGVIAQRLLWADRKGMVPALEIMINLDRIREMIAEPVRTREIKSATREGLHPYRMMTFDESPAMLVQERL
jgi:Tfp pilus assembly pilus retraction ATPase PilT